MSLKPEKVVSWGTLRADLTAPALIEPTVPNVGLSEWARGNVKPVERALRERGAILFRGFDITAPEALERFASVFVSELFSGNGEHPRATVSGQVYTPVFFPPEERLLWHNENSFNAEGPTKIWFCCQEPAEYGGETPIVDSRAMFDQLPNRIKAPFIEKGVMYVRNYGSGLGLDWRAVFGTTSKDTVERQCRRNSVEFEWLGDRLRTRCVRPAALRHPQTGDWSWFNQVQHWHISCLNEATRSGLLATFAEGELPRSCYYGDGTSIPDEALARICELYGKLEIVFRWQRGDVLMLDNILAAHGRNPFRGERKLLVAMGDMIEYR